MPTHDVRRFVFLVAMGSIAWTQAEAQGTTRRVTGRVIDADDQAPIPSATVRVQNSTIGATTTDSGTFAIRVPDGPQTLSVRRIGYTSATATLTADQTTASITLKRDVLKLEAEVITGVATTISSRNSANDVAVLSADQIGTVPAPTIENALQGKIPGAVIQQNNGGAPGGGLQVQIRGITSINSIASPLYVIDGVVVNNETINNGANAVTGASNNTIIQSNQDNSTNRIADLNPNDIETIEVLKGSSAAAIYGSKAASGVVVITTKKGLPGAPQWELSGQAGSYYPANTLGLRKFPTYESANAWYTNVFGSPTALPRSQFAGNQDFQDQLFGGGQLSGQGNLSVRGATGSTNYFASLKAQYDNGVMLGTGYRKQSVRTNLTQNFSPAIQGSANLYYQHSTTTRGITGNDNVGISPYNVFSTTPQFYNLNSFGNGAWVDNPFGFANPFADAAEVETPSDVDRFIGGGTASWQVFHNDDQDLRLSLIGGVDIASQHDIVYSPPNLQVEQHKALPGTSNISNSTNTYYNYSLSAIHRFTGLPWLDATTSIGVSQDRRTLDNPNIIGQDMPLGIQSPSAGAVQTSVETRTDTKTLSLYAQEQVLLFDQHLSLTAGVTADRNSNNGHFGRYYVYPKFAGSYRLPKLIDAIDDIKFRAAFGRSGTAPTYGFNYPNEASCTPVLNTFHGCVNGWLPNIPAFNFNDVDIRPETSTEVEAGIDITFLGSRAQFSGTVYDKKVKDLVLFSAPPASAGLDQIVLNGGQFTNQGIELSLQASPFADPKGFTWVSNATFYRNYSRVDNLPFGPFPTTYQFGGFFGTNIIQVGRSVSQFVNTAVLGPDGQAVQVGDATPSDVISFSEQLSFKGLHLSAVLDWYVGGNTSNLTNAYFDLSGLNLLSDSVASQRRFNSAVNGGTPYVEPARFVKLREVRLSYELPARWVRAIGVGRLRSVRLDVAGRNLLSSFPYTGLDPEVSNFGNLAVGRAQDVTPYPPAKSVFFGVTLGF